MLVADVPTARAAGSAFAATALWYNRTARCLSVSVATMHWLIARGCAATLVMGVKLHPFQAHCWVQVEGNLVNDDVDSVRPFVPIVVV